MLCPGFNLIEILHLPGNCLTFNKYIFGFLGLNVSYISKLTKQFQTMVSSFYQPYFMSLLALLHFVKCKICIII